MGLLQFAMPDYRKIVRKERELEGKYHSGVVAFAKLHLCIFALSL
jgi:hypothetical protein